MRNLLAALANTSLATPTITGPALSDFTLQQGTGATAATLTEDVVGTVRTLELTGDYPVMAVSPASIPNDVQVTARISLSGIIGMGLTQSHTGLIVRASTDTGRLRGYMGGCRWYNGGFGGMELREFWLGTPYDTGYPELKSGPTFPADSGSNAYRLGDLWLQMEATGTTIRSRSVLANVTAPENVPVVSSPPANTPTWPAWSETTTDATYTSGSIGIVIWGAGAGVASHSITLKNFEWEAI